VNKKDFLDLQVGDIVICKKRKAKVVAIDYGYGLVKIQYLSTGRQEIKDRRKLKLLTFEEVLDDKNNRVRLSSWLVLPC